MNVPAIDPVLHPPARLQIAAVLARTDEVEFAALRALVEVSDSVLSKHLSVLSDAGYIKLVKAPRDGRQRTWASFSSAGRKAFAAHMKALQALVESAQEGLSAA